MGLGGLEPPTSRLSGVRSNLLSYRPVLPGQRRQPVMPAEAGKPLCTSTNTNTEETGHIPWPRPGLPWKTCRAP